MKRLALVNLFMLPLLLSTQAQALFKSQPIKEIVATQHYQYLISLNAAAGEHVDLRLLEGPSSMRLLPGNKLIWQTDYADAGEHKVVLRADDGIKPQLQSFTLLVHKNNRKPLIQSIPSKEAQEGKVYFYQVDAIDEDNDPLTIQFLDYPKGAEVRSDSIRWEVAYGDAGKHPIRIRVSDGEASVEQSYTLHVKAVNRPPVFSFSETLPIRLKEYQSWSLQLKVADPDGDHTQLAMRNPPEGMVLENNRLTWQPSYTQSGDYSFEIVASDGELEAILALDFIVDNVNRLPEITSKPVSKATEADEYVYAVRAYDPDETLLSYNLLEGPEGMAFQDNILIWQTDYGDAGEYPVVFEVSDGEAAVKQSFTLELAHKNREPVIRSIPQTKIDEAEAFSYEFDVYDPDGDDLIVRYDIPRQVERDGNTLFWQTDYKDAGEYPFVIRVSDKDSTVEQRFVLKVRNINHKPVFTSQPPTQAYEAVYYEYQLTATDKDGEFLEFDLQEQPRGMQIKDGLIMWIPNFDQAGKHKVVASVSDGIDSVTQEFVINVDDTNREPNIEDINDQTLTVGERLHIALRVEDLDGDKLKTKLVYGPKGMKVTRRNEVVWKAGKNDLGSHDVIVEVTDGDLASRTNFIVEVVEK